GSELSSTALMWYNGDFVNHYGYGPDVDSTLQGFRITRPGCVGCSQTFTYQELRNPPNPLSGLSTGSLVKATGANSVGNSIATDDGSSITVPKFKISGADPLEWLSITNGGNYFKLRNFFSDYSAGLSPLIQINSSTGSGINAQIHTSGSWGGFGIDFDNGSSAIPNGNDLVYFTNLGAYYFRLKGNGNLFLPGIKRTATVADSALAINYLTGEAEMRPLNASGGSTNTIIAKADSVATAKIDSFKTTLSYDVLHSVTTTNATPTTIDTLAISSGQFITYEIFVHGYNSANNDLIEFTRKVGLHYSGGTVTIDWIDNPATDHAMTSVYDADIIFTVVGTLALVKVTGVSGVTIPWNIARYAKMISPVTP
ncbi:MAG: hypothetical protein KGO82_16450, partial [Bacteroidota bacterium]|nr:hypothetical protein [Bacteroidota bacterium]